MYHVELRQFPHNFCRFNLTDGELHETILGPWAQGQWIDLGERKWSPHQANLTVLEGPRLPIEQLSMGRGWRNATRQGQDVTERLLEAVRAAPRVQGSAEPGRAGGRDLTYASEEGQSAGSGPGRDRLSADVSSESQRLAADSLGLEVLAKLDSAPTPIASAWRLASERYPDLSASDCLRLAEHAVRSLVAAGLVVVLVREEGQLEPEPCEPGERLERVLGAAGSWMCATGSPTVLLGRK